MSTRRTAAPLVFLIILALGFAIPLTQGQGGAVRGQVYARDYLGDYVPAGFVTITVRSELFQTTIRTTPDGYYVVFLPIGIYNMTAMLSTVTIDYFQSKMIAVSDGSDTTINFYLQPTIIQLFQTTQVSVSVEGLPPQYGADLRVDGSSTGSVSGGERTSVEVDSRVDHTFSVQSSIDGSNGERFYCQDNSWNLENSAASTRSDKISHTFQYSTQFFLSVFSPAGDVGKNTGWYDKGQTILLTAIPVAEVSQGARYVFDSWTIAGIVSRDSSVNVILSSPIEARAQYHREYYLQLVSAYGSPSGSGWYDDGATTQIRIEKELPLPGLLGILGGRRIFSRWSGGLSSNSNIATLQMDSPKTIAANWQEDYSTTYFIIVALVILVIVAIVAAAYRARVT